MNNEHMYLFQRMKKISEKYLKKISVLFRFNLKNIHEPTSLYLGVSGVLRYPVEVAGDPGEYTGRLSPAVPAAE